MKYMIRDDEQTEYALLWESLTYFNPSPAEPG